VPIQCDLFNTSKNEIMTHATTWMNTKDIMVSEISQSQKDRYYMILLT
jgi:hypothetical protein